MLKLYVLSKSVQFYYYLGVSQLKQVQYFNLVQHILCENGDSESFVIVLLILNVKSMNI